jgi:metal-dependent amidase/aminoacylase/carboxypeptidase family protein
VLTCGTINGGFGHNIIADNVEICGTCRSFTPEVQHMIVDRMNDVCCGVAKIYGGEITMDYVCKSIFRIIFIFLIFFFFFLSLVVNYPPTVNAYPECNQTVVNAAARFVGKERACKPQKTMGAEDFSYFLQQRPGLNIYKSIYFIVSFFFFLSFRMFPLHWSQFTRRTSTTS